jgi:signal transduction histidine kinase
MVRPLRLALIVSVVFLAVSLVYIVISGQIAARLSETVGDLESVERIKGSIYVATTSLLLFTLCFYLFRGIAKRERELAELRSGMIAAERRAAAGLFASSVAHDMNNVLSIMDYATRHLAGDQGKVDAETLDDLQKANANLRRLSELLGRASGHHLGEAEADFDLAMAVRDTVALARTHRKVSICRFAVETPETLQFRGVPVLIHQMILNLVINAAEATNQSGTVTVKLTAANPGAVIEVHDDGPGIPDNLKNAIMEPFYTTKDDGSGLGLLSVKVCADAHHGSVQIERSHLGGACFKVRLKHPRPQSAPPPSSRPAELQDAARTPVLASQR